MLFLFLFNTKFDKIFIELITVKDVEFIMGELAKYFKKINFTNDDFKGTIVDKVVVHKLDNTWTIHITNKEPVNVESIESLKTISRNGFDEVKSVDFVIKNEKFCDEDILSYIKYYLSYLLNLRFQYFFFYSISMS